MRQTKAILSHFARVSCRREEKGNEEEEEEEGGGEEEDQGMFVLESSVILDS